MVIGVQQSECGRGAASGRLRSAVAIGSLLASAGAALALPPNVSRQQILGGLNQPVTVDFLPGDGRMLILHKPGHILIADPSSLPATPSNYLTLTDIDTGGFERGLMDIAFDPAFETNRHFYLYYSHASSGRFRISRFTHPTGGGGVDPASEVFIWQNNTSWGSHSHYGGGMGFGPDGKLYLTVGDDFDPPTAQDLSVADGKLIRINADGTIPADNPFLGQPGVLPEIWAYGLRNPFRAKWDLPTGRFIIGEVGGNDQATAWEDICIAVRGANYGWPACEGFCDDPAYEDPVFTYPHLGVAACMTGGMVYRGGQFPSEYHGAYFYADYSRGWVRYLTFDAAGTAVVSDTEFDTGVNSIVDFQTGPDGAIYYVRFGPGEVWRYEHDAGNQPPSIDIASVSVPVATAPVQAAFTGAATDAEMDPLTYTWIFGDGAEADGPNAVHTYAANGRYTAYLRVTDPTHTVLSQPIPIQIGQPPQATITSPADGATFRAGDEIHFTGSAADPDGGGGGIGPENLAWTVRFFHAGHSHGTSAPISGTSGAFTVPTTGHNFADDTHYQIILTVTDDDGLTDQATVRVYPETVNVSVDSTPAGAAVVWDGTPRTTPFTAETLVNFQHTISAPARFCVNQAEYAFDAWSDGGAAQHSFTVPASDLSLAATFTPTGRECELPVETGLVAWYRADSGVSVGPGGVAAAWQDASPSGHHLSGAGEPQLVPDAVNGLPAIRLDGVNDRMERIPPDSLALPAGNADRTMLAVVKYNGPGFGGLTYGDAACNAVFGLSVTPAGNLMIHGWCGGNDYASAAAGTGAGWMINEVVYQGGQDNTFRHYKDGALINTGTHTWATDPQRLVLGAEIDTTPHVALEVAELLIYNRALTDQERLAIENYLQDRYFTPPPPPCPYDIDGTPGVDVFDLLFFLDQWFAGCP